LNANLRFDGAPLPKKWPWGWMHLKAAVASLGTSLLDKGWPYDGFERAQWTAFDSDNAVLNQINRRTTDYCRANLSRIADGFSRAAFEGRFLTGYAKLGGGMVTPMPRDWWQTTDDELLRFRSFSVDPDAPFEHRPGLPCWIYVEQESFIDHCDRVARKRRGWPEEVPDCGDVITFSLREETARGRPRKTDRVLEIFGERVKAGTVAERCAWEGKAIHDADAPNERRATAKVCSDRIRPFFNMIEKTPDGKIANADAILQALGML
jgi:hypothetical protein